MSPQSIRFRWLSILCTAVVVAVTLSYSRTWHPTRISLTGQGEWPAGKESASSCSSSQASEAFHTLPVDTPEWDSSRVLKGPPTENFRDNLREELFYITSWSNAGFTNQFMSYVNMIYLGMLSDRVPIIPPLAPDHHISSTAGILPFGKIYNLTRARQSMRQALVEWQDVKDLRLANPLQEPPDEIREPLGCWSTRHETERLPMKVQSMLNYLQFDISYTRIPSETRNIVWSRTDDFVDFGHLVPYIFPRQPLRPREGHFPIMHDSPLHRRLHPDDQLSCFDFLYYLTSSHETFEWKFPWAPAWIRVGTHMHFTDELKDIVSGYLSRVFRTSIDDVPPFIAVHMRRGDFAKQCLGDIPPEECLIPLEKFARKVNVIRDEIRRKQNRELEEVILMSDETDPKFWGKVNGLGWVHFDHTRTENTVERYGEWYPAILDQVAQSMAAGFVGTEDSTYSLVGARRVQDWNNGPTITVYRDVD